MYFYLGLSLIPLLVSSFVNTNHDKGKRRYLLITFGVLAVFACLRGPNVGTDTSSYLSDFNLVKQNGISIVKSTSSYEYGYYFILNLFSHVFSSGQSIIIFFTGITYIIVAYAIYKHSTNVVMSTFLFVVWILPSSMNGMRQHFAFAIVLLAFVQMLENKMVKALVLLTIAFLFHNSALIFVLFLVVYLYRRKWPQFTGIVLLGCSYLVAYLFINQAIQFVTNLFPRYAHYLVTGYYDRTKETNLVWLIIYVIFVFLCYVIYKRKFGSKENIWCYYDSASVYYMLLLLLHISVILLSVNRRSIFDRLTVYTEYASVFIMPYVISNIFKYSAIRLKARNQQIIRIVFYIAFIAWDVLMLSQNPHYIIPYTSCFSAFH